MAGVPGPPRPRYFVTSTGIAGGEDDVAEIQIDAALRAAELDAEQLREIVIFLTHYAGWPTGAKLSVQAEKLISQQQRGSE